MEKKIKILHLIDSMGNGGAQRVVLNYLSEFQNDTNIELKVLVYKNKTDSYCDREIENKNYSVDYLFKNMNNRYLRKFIEVLFGKRLLTNYIKKYKPDIIHIHIFAFLTICIKPILRCNIPIIFYTLHSNPYRNKGKNLKYMKMAFQQENFIGICLNEEQAKQASKYYEMKKFEIVHNGIDINKIKDEMISKEEARKKFRINYDCFVIGAIGRLNTIKKYDMLLKIFEKVKDVNEKAILVIAGDGPEKEKLINLSKMLKIENKVIFLGNIDNTTELYCAMDVFVITSRTEASPLVLIESQICGDRCVISNGTPEESIITNRVKKMKENSTIDDWKNAILDINFKGEQKLNLYDYDLKNSTNKMKSIYLKYWKEYCNFKNKNE